MNAQQMEYVRIQLRGALADDSGGTKGQLVAFAEHPPTDNNLNPRKQIHVVELDNGRGGVHRVKAENSSLYVKETRNRRRPMPPIRDKTFSSCAWRRAVLKLDATQQAWLLYCYGHNLDYQKQIKICEKIWWKLSSEEDLTTKQQRVKRKISALVWLAVQSISAENGNVNCKRYAGTLMASLLTVSRQTWMCTYSYYWKRLLFLVKDFDSACLREVASHVT